MLKTLCLPLVLVLSGCCTVLPWTCPETDPDKITTTVGEWEPPMIDVLGELLEYRPELEDEVEPWIELFSQEPGSTIIVGSMRPLQGLLMLYIHELDQDDTLTSEERELAVAIPNLWLEALRNFLDDQAAADEDE